MMPTTLVSRAIASNPKILPELFPPGLTRSLNSEHDFRSAKYGSLFKLILDNARVGPTVPTMSASTIIHEPEFDAAMSLIGPPTATDEIVRKWENLILATPWRFPISRQDGVRIASVHAELGGKLVTVSIFFLALAETLVFLWAYVQSGVALFAA